MILLGFQLLELMHVAHYTYLIALNKVAAERRSPTRYSLVSDWTSSAGLRSIDNTYTQVIMAGGSSHLTKFWSFELLDTGDIECAGLSTSLCQSYVHFSSVTSVLAFQSFMHARMCTPFNGIRQSECNRRGIYRLGCRFIRTGVVG